MHQNQSILMMAQGQSTDQNFNFLPVQGRALGEVREMYTTILRYQNARCNQELHQIIN